jgi:outer membrane receptor protein involved in Fe transport
MLAVYRAALVTSVRNQRMMAPLKRMGITRYAAILCLAAAAAPAAADDRAPHSLRMRSPRAAHPPTSPVPISRRVAQLPPDGAPGDPPASPAPGAPPASPPPGDPPASPPPASPPPGDPASPAPGDPASPAPGAPPAGPAIPVPPAPPTASPPAKLTDEELAALARETGKFEVITVTDPSIEHTLLTGRAPVSVVTQADLAASGRATLGDILQSLPAQSNAGNAQVNAGGDGTTRINLRGLGAPRTLVLLNGRRLVNGGAGADAAVDLNAIPLSAIERVEILKDGASAIYGADAVGGVVNLITRPQYDGIDVSLLTSTSQRGDGTEYEGSFVTGFTTKDRNTYLVVSGSYQHHGAVLAGDRGFSTFQRSYDFAGRTEARDGSSAVPASRLDTSSIGVGGVPSGVHLAGCGSDVCKLDGSGGWTDFVAPRDLYNEAATNYLYTPSSRYNVFASAGNRISDNAAVLVELLYQRRGSDRQLSPVAFVADAPISKDSIYNPFTGDVLDYRRRIVELGPRQYIDQVTTSRAVLGITGTVPEWVGQFKDWKYEVSYNYGATKSLVNTTGQLNKLRLADALGPSMYDADGVPICVRKPGDATTKIIYMIDTHMVPCVPANLLTRSGPIPGDQLKLLTFTDAGSGDNGIRSLLATTRGRITELPNHGDISLSLGGDYRDEVGQQFPSSLASAGYTTDNEAHATDGEFHIFEGYGELAIVPVSGRGIAQWVELDLGARALRHSRFGSSLTYKAGGLFRTVAGIALRGTYATAFRAPSLSDILGGQAQRTPSAEDPCDTKPPSAGEGSKTLDPMVQAQCTAQGVPVGSKFTTNQQLSVIGGNPDLKPETAATATVGIVIEPPRLPGLALSVDYWHITIASAIETLGVQTIFANCYDRGVQSYCDQIHRDRISHRISPVDQFLQNVARTATSGVDLALRYDTQLAELGRLRTALEAQYLVRYDLDTSQQVIHGVGFYDLGVYPRYKANLSSRWAHPSGGSGGFTLRYVGAYTECAGNDCNSDRKLASESREVDRYVKLDLFGGYDFRSGIGRTTLQLGINNVFDASPPLVYNAAAANSDAATYDFVGRLVYLRLSQQY